MTTERNKSPLVRQAIRALEQGIAAQSGDTKHQKLCEAHHALRAEPAGDVANLLEIALEHHLYNATNFSYLNSPLARKTHDALARAGILDNRGYLNKTAADRVDVIGEARGQQRSDDAKSPRSRHGLHCPAQSGRSS